MEIETIGAYYALLMLVLIALILIFNSLIRSKYLKMFDILVKYPKVEKEMLAFRRFRNPYGFVPFAHPEYFIPIVKRFFLLESFSNTKTHGFYKNFYRYDLIEKTKDKDLKKNIDFILRYAPIRDTLFGLFFIFFILSIIFGIFYSFRL